MDIPTIQEFLQMLAGPVGWGILGAFVSVACSKWPWFEQQESEIKQAIVIALSALSSMLSHVAYVYIPADVLAAIGPYWIILYGTIGTWTGGQVVHRLDKAV